MGNGASVMKQKIEAKLRLLLERMKEIEQTYTHLKSHLDQLSGEYAAKRSQALVLEELLREDDDEGNQEVDEQEVIHNGGNADTDGADHEGECELASADRS